MKKTLPAILLLCLFSSYAQQPRVFTSYEELYSSLPDRLFIGEGEEIAVLSQHGVSIDGKQYRFGRAIAFPGENVYPEDLGRSATLFRSAGHYCVQGTGTTSGTGSRHQSVYLIARKAGHIRKLPSLFGSCKSLAMDTSKQIRFVQARIVNYRSAYDADGVEFIEYEYAGDGKSAVPSGAVFRIGFVEAGNFYKFRLLEN